MRHTLSFAVTLHRAFDSAPPNAKASFYGGNRLLYPIEKPNGLYVFLQEAESPLTVMCEGFMPANVELRPGKAVPAALYPDRLFNPPPEWRLIAGEGEPEKLLYFIDSRYEVKLTEHNAGQAFARIRSRRGFTGGCLLFEAGDQREIALILEKRSPDIFYLSELEGDYTDRSVHRVYCAQTDARGRYYLAVPDDFTPEALNYL